jgi:hypothetical protein
VASPAITPPPSDDQLNQAQPRQALPQPPQQASPSPQSPQQLVFPPGGQDQVPPHVGRFKQLLELWTGGGVPAIHREVEADYQRKQSEIQMFHQAAANYNGLLAYAHATGLNKMTGKPATQDEINQWDAQEKRAWAEYSKLAGVNKNAKGILGKMGQVLQHVTGRGQQQQQQGQGQGQQQGGPPKHAIQPPPPAPPIPMGEGEAMQSQYMSQMGDQAQAERAKIDEAVQTYKGESALKVQEPGQELTGQYETLKGIYGEDEAKKMMAAKYQGAAGRAQMPKPIWIQDPNNPAEQIRAWEDPVSHEIRGQDGEPVENAQKVVPTMLPRYRESYYTYTDDAGQVHQVPVESRSGVSMPGGQSPAAKKPGSALPGPEQPLRSTGTPATHQKNVAAPPTQGGGGRVIGTKNTGLLTTQAQTVLEATSPVVEQVDRLLGDIKNLKLEGNNTPGYLSWARMKYGLGISSPEGTLGKDIAGLSLGSVVEAASVLKGASRSLAALKVAFEHTPNPWKDSPQLMAEKLKTIRERLQDVINDAQKYGQKRSALPSPEKQGTGTKDDPIIVK